MEDKEEWKVIRGYSKYKISSYGRVWSEFINRYRKPYKNKNGYYYVSLHGDTNEVTRFSIHRLVALHFVENSNPEEYNVVNHLDENKTNNHASNLEWTDTKGNVNWGTATYRSSQSHVLRDTKKKVPVSVFSTDGEFIDTFTSIRHASREMNVSRTTVTTSLNHPNELPVVESKDGKKYVFRYRDDNKESFSYLRKLDMSTRGINNPVNRTKESVNEELKSRNIPYELLDEYRGVHARYNFKCLIHNKVFNRELNAILRKENFCPECSDEHRLSIVAKGIDYYQNKIDEHEFNDITIVSGTIGSEPASMKCNKCGKEFSKPPVQLAHDFRGNGCPRCNKRHTAIINNMHRANRTDKQIREKLDAAGLKW